MHSSEVTSTKAAIDRDSVAAGNHRFAAIDANQNLPASEEKNGRMIH